MLRAETIEVSLGMHLYRAASYQSICLPEAVKNVKNVPTLLFKKSF